MDGQTDQQQDSLRRSAVASRLLPVAGPHSPDALIEADGKQANESS